MLLVRPFPLSTSSSCSEDADRRGMERVNSCSMSEEEDGRHDGQEEVGKEEEQTPLKTKKHRRGKKRGGGPGSRPKWKPYSKMSLEERKQVDEWEEKHVAIREAEINARSKRPVAPFNSTQFLIEDRCEDQYRRPSRTLSYDSSSGDDVHYEPASDEEQEAFLEADFNQVYLQLKLNRLEGMSKQDLISQCCNLEDKVSMIEQEKLELLSQLQQLKEANRLTEGKEGSGDITTQ